MCARGLATFNPAFAPARRGKSRPVVRARCSNAEWSEMACGYGDQDARSRCMLMLDVVIGVRQAPAEAAGAELIDFACPGFAKIERVF